MLLHLTLKHKWFDQIKSGVKTIEYREIKPFWTKRIWEKRNQITEVIFHRGYTRDIIHCKISKIDIGPSPYPEMPDTYYRLHLIIQ